MICERGLGGQSWEDYGFYIPAKPPGLDVLAKTLKSLSSPKAAKFEFLFLHSVLSGGRGGPGCLKKIWGGSEGMLETKRLWASRKLPVFIKPQKLNILNFC